MGRGFWSEHFARFARNQFTFFSPSSWLRPWALLPILLKFMVCAIKSDFTKNVCAKPVAVFKVTISDLSLTLRSYCTAVHHFQTQVKLCSGHCAWTSNCISSKNSAPRHGVWSRIQTPPSARGKSGDYGAGAIPWFCSQKSCDWNVRSVVPCWWWAARAPNARTRKNGQARH